MKEKASIGRVVTEELEKNPLLLELFQQGLGNVSAIATYLHPTIEHLLKRKVKLSALGMCIRRQIGSISSVKKSSRNVPPPVDISTRTGIYEVAVAQSSVAHEKVDKIRKTLVTKREDYLSIAEGQYEIVIFTNQRNKKQLVKLLGKLDKTSERDNLGCVTVNWAEVTKDIPGIYYKVTRALAFRSISIQSFHTIGAEMSIFVKEDVLGQAYEALTKLLKTL